MKTTDDIPGSTGSPGWPFLLLACALSTFPAVTGDMYLPALPQLTADLGGTTAQGQQTLAGYFFGLGLGQLFYGPLADRIGRRPVMLFGATLYVAATLGCLLAASIEHMIVLRFLQAIAACSGVVISSAMVRDRFSHQESARVFSMLLTARSLGPLLAPVVGGIIVTFFGWRGVFGVLGLFGLTLLLAVLFGMTETRTEMVAQQARVESPLRAYRQAIRNPEVLGYLITNGMNFSILFAWITVAPFLIIEVYRVPEAGFGWIFAALALGIMIASQLNRHLLRRYRADGVMLCGAVLAVVAAVVLVAMTMTGAAGIAGVMVPLFFAICSLGFVSTNAMAGALSADTRRTGSISALVGAGQFGFAALVAAGTGRLAADPAVAMAIVIAGCSLGALVFPLVLFARRAEGRKPGENG